MTDDDFQHFILVLSLSVANAFIVKTFHILQFSKGCPYPDLLGEIIASCRFE